jgi:hypothetical protein
MIGGRLVDLEVVSGPALSLARGKQERTNDVDFLIMNACGNGGGGYVSEHSLLTVLVQFEGRTKREGRQKEEERRKKKKKEEEEKRKTRRKRRGRGKEEEEEERKKPNKRNGTIVLERLETAVSTIFMLMIVIDLSL